jgi:hypothetical protein
MTPIMSPVDGRTLYMVEHAVPHECPLCVVNNSLVYMNSGLRQALTADEYKKLEPTLRKVFEAVWLQMLHNLNIEVTPLAS